MNILINIPTLDKTQGGVYQYSMALLNLLSTTPLKHTFIIYCINPSSDLRNLVNTTSNFKLADCELPRTSIISKLLLRISNKILKFFACKVVWNRKDIYDLMIKKYNINIIHALANPLVKKKNIKSIVTIHDVQELHFPEFFSSGQRAYRSVSHKRSIDEADAIIVSYDHIKEDIVKLFDKPRVFIYTILLDMQNLWFKKIKLENLDYLKEVEIPDKFILYPASTWPHKNHLTLLKAFSLLENKELKLVCTGNKTEYFDSILLPFIKIQNLEKRVKFLGIVSDEALLALYKKSRAVIVPTLYEAGSFPLMESILLGIPVVCSKVTSLPETIGDLRFVFDPNDIHDIKDKIDMIVNNSEYRLDNIKLLKNQSEKLINNNAVLKLENIYEQLFHQ